MGQVHGGGGVSPAAQGGDRPQMGGGELIGVQLGQQGADHAHGDGAGLSGDAHDGKDQLTAPADGTLDLVIGNGLEIGVVLPQRADGLGGAGDEPGIDLLQHREHLMPHLVAAVSVVAVGAVLHVGDVLLG